MEVENVVDDGDREGPEVAKTEYKSADHQPRSPAVSMSLYLYLIGNNLFALNYSSSCIFYSKFCVIGIH